MSLSIKVRGALIGGGFGLIVFVSFILTEDLAVTFNSANLIYAFSGLAVCVPATIASLVSWNFFPAFTICYWALIGWLFSGIQRRRKMFSLLLVAFHLLALLAVDFATQSIPTPIF